MALQQHIIFATRHHISVQQRFPELLFRLLSSRPDVCSDALDSFPDFLALAMNVLHSEFFDYAKGKTSKADLALGVTTTICIHNALQHYGDFQLPLSLLQAICVVLGIYHVHSCIDDAAADLALALLRDVEADADDKTGLASAMVLESGTPAISVEWVSRQVLSMVKFCRFSHRYPCCNREVDHFG
jgi:hypothetical protein